MKLPRLPRRSDFHPRVEEARQAAVQATAENKLSRDRARHVRNKVVDPLLAIAAHNQFADLLRRSLIEESRDG